MGFKDMFRMSVTYYEFFFFLFYDLISTNERISRDRHILADERLALILRYPATGDSFQSLTRRISNFLDDSNLHRKGML